jgi:two-component system phosphate regulon sensor histidine kinase PhoR
MERKIIIFNKAAERITGYTEAEVLGKYIGDLFHVYDKNAELSATTYAPIRTDGFEGKLYSLADVTFIGKAGKKAHITLTAGQIKEAMHINLGCLLILHDTTEQKELEEMKLDFVSMAAHELRTPLTSIRGYLSVYISENKQQLTDEQMMFLQRINIASEQLMSLVENLLNVTRIEKGAMALNFQAIDWTKYVNGVVEQLSGRAKEKRINLTFKEPDHQIRKVIADNFRIAEVLNNLLANAINYTNENGSVTVWLEEKNGKVVTHVQDTGEGIPQEAISHLFTKFFRVSGALEQGSKGTGLGLFIAKAIVEMHNGTIWVESEEGKGSTFSFSLPAENHG